MRKISLVLVAAMLLSISSAFANEGDSENPSKRLAVQISELLRDNSFSAKHLDMTAQVKFMLNEKREIVILAINADNEVLESFVNEKLNYQKVNVEEYKEGRTYTMPVRIAG
ncbi:hypothetical protein D9O36_12555 [Zobellia amurskyensis]|uniref:Uncharacterized protein n=1 Tax=Zobellia amurskyensis TaxID=248905 RepID=A0A7X3D233_9FLAO|nr:hypothetical protein [Zobellia amurskyensis]MUH36676.1 hypothetical protein [Zobellia amurskyensis]